MYFSEYQKLAMRTRPVDAWDRQFLQAGIGMAEEAGEVLGLVKKAYFHGHEIKWDKIEEECGDLLWHIALMAEVNGKSLEKIAEQNIEKLKKRYPEGFNKEDSIRRVDTKVEANE